MNDRIIACRLLAGALFDLLYSPETSTGAMLRKQTLRGEAPTEWSACERCDGEGHDRFRRSCTSCDGQGRVKIDPYTGRVVASEQSAAPPRVDSWTCNFCHGNGIDRGRPAGPACPVCGGRGVREHPPLTSVQPVDLGKGDPETVLEAAILRRDQAGSFHELEQCLAILRRQSPHRHRVYWQVTVLHDRAVADLDDRERRWLQEADEDLARMMPVPIRVPAYLLAAERTLRQQLRSVRGREMDEQALARRDAEIRRLHEQEGRAPAELAAEFRISTRQVQRVLYGSAA